MCTFTIDFVADTFGQYDYGPAMNMKYYNTTEPPTYDLKSIHVPITLIYGENDILSDTEVSSFLTLKTLQKYMYIYIINTVGQYHSRTVFVRSTGVWLTIFEKKNSYHVKN